MAAVRRIVVGVHGSLGSLQALRWAAEEARARQVPLVPVIAWVPPGGDLSERSHPSQYLRQVWRDAACQRLAAAFDAGLGGMPSDLRVQPCVERGETGPVLVDIADQPGDLLVIGTGRRSLVGLGVDAHHAVNDAFGAPVLVGRDDARDVIAQRSVADRQGKHEQADLQEAGQGRTH